MSIDSFIKVYRRFGLWWYDWDPRLQPRDVDSYGLAYRLPRFSHDAALRAGQRRAMLKRARNG